MAKNVCIVHFNTPALTACLIKSLNKCTPGTNIYVFDNSDKRPFINEFDNVTVFDNTRGQIINFDEWLKKYPNRKKSAGAVNNFGSAKHCYTIQKCIELIGENFVLLDSDVLLKKDISSIWDGRFVWVGGVERWSSHLTIKRACPFLLYLNVEKMKELGITFFSDTHMFGLKNGNRCEEFDTGTWLYAQTKEKNRKIINYKDYIVHFRAASWLSDARTKHHYKQMEPKRWLIINKRYWVNSDEDIKGSWYENYEKNILPNKTMETSVNAINNNMENIFNHVYCLHYLPITDRLSCLKEELRRVGIDENANYFSWIYDYPTQLLDLVYNDKRTNMDVVLKSTSREFAKRKSLKHYEILKDAYSSGYDRILILEDDVRFHNDIEYIGKMLSNMPDTDVVLFDKMVSSEPNEAVKYKRYIKTLPEDSLYGNIKDSGVFFIFSSCYSVNRKAMKRMIELYENSLLPSDTPLNDKELSGSFAINNLAIQDPKFKTRKNETYDHIGLNVNAYNTIKTDPEMRATPKQQPPTVILGKKNKDSQTSSKKPHQVIFKMPTKPQKKKRIEPAPVTKTQSATQKTALPKKKQVTHTRTINGKTSGFNKLYDVWA